MLSPLLYHVIHNVFYAVRNQPFYDLFMHGWLFCHMLQEADQFIELLHVWISYWLLIDQVENLSMFKFLLKNRFSS